MSSTQASTTRGVTRVLLLADAPVLRRGLVSMINETAGMQAVGTPGEPRRALTLVETARPDAVIVELGAGRAATLNACRDLRRRFPRVASIPLASLALVATVALSGCTSSTSDTTKQVTIDFETATIADLDQLLTSGDASAVDLNRM